MQEKSFLEKTNSWIPFIEAIEEALRAHDYRISTMKSILEIVDPTMPMRPNNLWDYFKGMLLGSGFVSGREALYSSVFERFLMRNTQVFDQAPAAVIETFNRLLKALFSPPVAEKFLLDTRIAKAKTKEEALVRKAKKGIQNWSKTILKNSTEDLSTAPTQEEEPLEKNPPLSEGLNQHILSITQGSPLFEAHIKEIESAAEQFHQQLYRLYPTVALWKQLPFQDLRQTIEQNIVYDADESLLSTLFHESDLVKVRGNLAARMAQQLEVIRDSLQRTDERNQCLSWVVNEKVRLHKLVEPYIQNADLRKQAEKMVRAINSIAIDETLFSSSEVDSMLKEKKKALTLCTKEIEAQVEEMKAHLKKLYSLADSFRLVIMAARWEILSGTTPYPDLLETIETVRAQFINHLEVKYRIFLAGEMSLADYFDAAIKLMYEHNIKFIRGELMARSLRLTDLRKAILEELLPLKRHLALIKLAGGSSQELEHSLSWLLSRCVKLFDPYALFKDGVTPESIDILFRYWWLDLERWKRGKEARSRSFFIVASRHPNGLIEPIAQTLDCIEKCTDKQLYRSFREATAAKTGEILVSAVDQWLSDHTSDLIEQMIPQLSLMHMPELGESVARAVFLQSQMAEVFSFAKNLQAIKTFEPERIDAIVEVFSLFPVFDPSQLPLLEKALATVNETLLVELGIIDKKARLEVGQAMTKLLPHTLIKVRSILDSLQHEMALLSAKSDPPSSQAAKRFRAEVTTLAVRLPTLGFEIEPLFLAFQKLAVLIFYKRILTADIPLTQRQEILLMAENKEERADMARYAPMPIPHLNFIPGDMSFFIQGLPT